jgi:hypothetical protein
MHGDIGGSAREEAEEKEEKNNKERKIVHASCCGYV